MTASIFDPKYKKFRRLLIESRQKRGMTQTQLAERLRRPQSFISKYENGGRRIDLIEFLEIADPLMIDPVDFIRRLQSEKEL